MAVFIFFKFLKLSLCAGGLQFSFKGIVRREYCCMCSVDQKLPWHFISSNNSNEKIAYIESCHVFLSAFCMFSEVIAETIQPGGNIPL